MVSQSWYNLNAKIKPQKYKDKLQLIFLFSTDVKLSKLNPANCLPWPSRVYPSDTNLCIHAIFSGNRLKREITRLSQQKEKSPKKMS